jgi:cell division protein FtsI/penicillin-binding protein 2
MVGPDSTDRQADMFADDPGPDYASRRKRARVIAGAVGVVVLLGGLAAAAVFLLVDNDAGEDPDATATAFLEAWEQGDIDTMAANVDEPPAELAETYETFADELRVESAEFELGHVEREGDDAQATFEATLGLRSLGEWTYEGNLRLRRTGENGTWLVDWSPAALHPRQQDGDHLTLVSDWPDRGTITDAAGEPLVSEQAATLVGIDQQLMTDIEDRTELHEAFEDHLDIDPATVDAALDAPGVEPEHLVEVVVVPEERFRRIESDLRPVPGIVFRERTLRMGPNEGFAAHLIGATGEVTAELLEELGEPYATGDIVGLNGLEGRFERELAGSPGGEIRVVNDASTEEEDADDDSVEILGEEPEEEDPVVHTFEGTDPVDVPTTLDPEIQLAVDTALDGVDKATGAVVVDREGNIRAAASRPLDDGFNRAFQGNYPPGSTFKVVTTEALLADGLQPDDRIDCAETIVAGGREFKNFEDAQLGSVPFRRAFAESCNTAFISATGALPGSDLVAGAERFGFNSVYSIGLTTADPSFPEPDDPAEQAAASIGQGRILASPLHMATVAAAVNEGTWNPPTLLPELEPSDDTPPPEPQELDPDAAATITELMELVVTEGSGDAAATDEGTVAGKTGTAEFGEGDPLPTHAWFIGSRGDLAVALIIEDGGVGGRDAAPVAGEIFAALPE